MFAAEKITSDSNRGLSRPGRMPLPRNFITWLLDKGIFLSFNFVRAAFCREEDNENYDVIPISTFSNASYSCESSRVVPPPPLQPGYNEQFQSHLICSHIICTNIRILSFSRLRVLCALAGKFFFPLVFLYFMFPVSAFGSDFEQGFALRQILEIQRWPKIFSDLNAEFRRDSLTFQALSRFWIKKKTETTSLNFEVENNGFAQTNQIQQKNLGGNWSGGNQGARSLEFWNLSKKHHSGKKSEVSSTIERLDFSWSMGKWDFDLGRQPISLGTSHFLGILDILSPFHPGYLDSSYKPGIDAFRIRTGFGAAGEAEIIAVPTRPWQNRATLGRWRNNFSGFDFEIVGGRFRDRNMAGIGYDGERKKITYWGEIAFFERKPQKEGFRGGNPRFALSWISGCEKEIRPKLRMGLAVMHQDFGVSDSKKLVQVFSDAPFKEGWTFLGGKTYGLLTMKKECSPLINGDLSGIWNANDGSTLWQPKVTFNTGDNSDIAVFSWLATGKSPSTAGFSVSTPSEFGLFPSGLGVIARRFF